MGEKMVSPCPSSILPAPHERVFAHCCTPNPNPLPSSSQEYALPEMFKGWDIFVAQSPILPASHPLYFTSPWTASCNVIMLDEKRVVVEASEEPTIKAFESWGFETIKVGDMLCCAVLYSLFLCTAVA